MSLLNDPPDALSTRKRVHEADSMVAHQHPHSFPYDETFFIHQEADRRGGRVGKRMSQRTLPTVRSGPSLGGESYLVESSLASFSIAFPFVVVSRTLGAQSSS
jgi:hypothetical protein